MKDYRQLVGQLMREMKMDQTAFASAVGVSQGTVSRWLAGSEPKVGQMAKIDKLAAQQAFPRLEPELPTMGRVSVFGKLGAGAEIFPEHEQVPPEGLYEIEVPFPVPAGARAFVIEGDSMWPRYDAGDVVVCWTEILDPDVLNGAEAAVQTADGHRYLKRVRRGSSKRLFDLESHNASPIRDVRLEWAARVSAIVKKDDWRSITRAAAR